MKSMSRPLHSPHYVDGGGSRLPVLIIPGFMSSGLEVRKSGVNESWVGKRVWMDFETLGFSSNRQEAALQKDRTMGRIDHDENGKFDLWADMCNRYSHQTECKSAWLQHMNLSDDMINERPGNEVRAIPGLEGVEQITRGGLTTPPTCDFGPVVKVLKEAGYTAGHDLDAAPYDWRLPPSELERRDKYFTNMMHRLEVMYQQNSSTPVVLICHSLGCRTGHYFLNFVRSQQHGEKWLDKHIHTYMPVGAPHLGVPKELRAMISGDKMGLDAFLSDEEGLAMRRSLGSGPWLLPRALPLSEDAMPSAFIRREGTLEVKVLPIDCSSLLKEVQSHMPKLRLALEFGGEVIMSGFRTPGGANGTALTVPETFIFATSPDVSNLRGPELSDSFTVALQVEVGRQSRKKVGSSRSITRALNAWTTLAESKPYSIKHRLLTRKEKTLQFKMVITQDEKKMFSLLQSLPFTSVTIKLKWVPPSPPRRETQPLCNVATLTNGSDPKAYGLIFDNVKRASVQYEASNGVELLQTESLNRIVSLLKERYERDPMGPRTVSAEGAPPVSRVKAVYGINVPTEVGAVYRLKKALVIKPGGARQRLMLDSKVSVRMIKNGGIKVTGGIIQETNETPQTIDGKTVYCSGDGTVPYWSLQQCRAWRRHCNVSIEEIEGAEHGEILADERFHKILVDYVTQKEGFNA